MDAHLCMPWSLDLERPSGIVNDGLGTGGHGRHVAEFATQACYPTRHRAAGLHARVARFRSLSPLARFRWILPVLSVAGALVCAGQIVAVVAAGRVAVPRHRRVLARRPTSARGCARLHERLVPRVPLRPALGDPLGADQPSADRPRRRRAPDPPGPGAALHRRVVARGRTRRVDPVRAARARHRQRRLPDGRGDPRGSSAAPAGRSACSRSRSSRRRSCCSERSRRQWRAAVVAGLWPSSRSRCPGGTSGSTGSRCCSAIRKAATASSRSSCGCRSSSRSSPFGVLGRSRLARRCSRQRSTSTASCCCCPRRCCSSSPFELPHRQ